MKTILTSAIVFLGIVNAFPQGTVHFTNLDDGRPPSVDAPFFDDQGVRLEGDRFLAQLYAGESPEQLQAVDPPVPFGAGSRRGYFGPATIVIPFIPGKVYAWLQVRAWAAAGGASFETAAESGYWTGISNEIKVFAGDPYGTPPSPPAKLDGLKYPGKPIIVRNPANRSVRYGGSAVLSVVGSGGVTLFYQWYEGESGNINRPMLNATNAAWTTGTLTNASSFWVQLTTSAGTANSTAATVTVQSANEVWLDARQSQAGPVFELHGPVDTAYRIQYSTNLAETAWTTLMDLRPLSSPTTFTDSTTANAPVRFYRAVSP